MIQLLVGCIMPKKYAICYELAFGTNEMAPVAICDVSILPSVLNQYGTFALGKGNFHSMKLQSIRLEDLSTLKYAFFSCSFLEQPHLIALIVAFEGEYGNGSRGNNDATFMEALSRAALAAWSPTALILDLRQLTYQWGDELLKAIQVGQDRYFDGPFPTAIVISEKNSEGLTSLVLHEMASDPAVWLFNSLDEALRAVEE